MNNLYSDDYIVRIENKKKKSLIMIFIIMGFATLLNVRLLFLANEYNKTLMEIVLSTIYVVAGWISIWFLIDGVIKSNNKLSAIKSILAGEKKEFDGVIKRIDKIITLANSTRCYEIVLEKDNAEHKLYFDEIFDVSVFKEETNMRLTVSNNFIISYEVKKDESQE